MHNSTIIPNQILQSSINLSPVAKLLLLTLKSYDWRDSGCFPSQGTLARAVGVHPDTLRVYTRELVEARFLTYRRRWGKTSVYVLSIPTEDVPKTTYRKSKGVHTETTRTNKDSLKVRTTQQTRAPVKPTTASNDDDVSLANAPKEPEPDASLVSELEQLGVTSSVAIDLVKKESLENIRLQIDSLPYYKPRLNKAGFLVSAIRLHFVPPKAALRRSKSALSDTRTSDKAQDRESLKNDANASPRGSQEAQLMRDLELKSSSEELQEIERQARIMATETCVSLGLSVEGSTYSRLFEANRQELLLTSAKS